MNSSVALRGLTKLPVGETTPAVVTYFAETAEPNIGIDIPTYDLSDVQVLKGPQGTLFGKNTIGGAILLTPQAPAFNTDGYVQGSYGNLNYRDFQGAVNLPLLPNLLAVRIAGEVRNRDGMEKNITGGADFDNINQQSIRVSALLTPSENFRNTTIFDYFRAYENPLEAIAFQYHPGVLVGPLAPYGAAANAAVRQQQAMGPWQTYGPLPDVFANRESMGFIDTAQLDLGPDTYIKNIFSYRIARVALSQSSDGLPLLGGPLGDFSVLKPTGLSQDDDIWSEELQLGGSTFHNRIKYVFGGIYSETSPVGSDGNFSNGFSFTGLKIPKYTTQQLGSTNEGQYGQVGFDISDWTIRGLSVDAGYRVSWDQVYGCGVGLANGYVNLSQCESLEAKVGSPGGLVKATDNLMPSYTLGVNYKINDNLFLYGDNRLSYRGVNVNVPYFYSPFTTGGSGCVTFTGVGVRCPDLRPYQTTRPEIVRDWELGLKSTWHAGRVHGLFDIALYNTHYSNAVQFVNFQPTGLPATAPDAPQSEAPGLNVATLTIRGIEVNSTVTPLPGLTLAANGAYTDQGVDSVSVPPIGGLSITRGQIDKPSPRWSGTATLSYTPYFFHPLQSNVLLTVDDYVQTDTRQQFGVALPGYNVVDLRLDFRNIAARRIDLGFWMKNALDRTYVEAPQVVIAAFPIASGLYGERRTFGFDLRYAF